MSFLLLLLLLLLFLLRCLLLLLLLILLLHLFPSFDVIQFVLVSIFLHRRLSIQLPSSLFVFYLPGMGTVNGPCWKKRSEIEIQTETRTVVNFYNGLYIPTEQRYTRFLLPPPPPFLSFFFLPFDPTKLKIYFSSKPIIPLMAFHYRS